MSHLQAARRRISLLAGSSLLAAGLSAFVSASAALAPSPARAAEECGALSPSPTPDVVFCSGPIGTYTDGVTYVSQGDLTVESTVDANEFGGDGIHLTGDGADNVSFVADGVEVEGRDLSGALVDITTATGNIDILTENVDADAHNPAAMTHGIRAISTGGGTITIESTGVIDAESTSQNTPLTGRQSGIEAVTAGGLIDITAASVTGRENGILAEAFGGDIVIDLTSSVTAASAGVAASTTGAGSIGIVYSGTSSFGAINSSTTGVLATTESGDIDIHLNRVLAQGGTSQFGINAVSTGGGDINISTGNLTQSSTAQFDVGIYASTAGVTTLDIVGRIFGKSSAITIEGGGGAHVTFDNGAGDPLDLNSYAFLIGNVDFAEAGPVQLDFSSSGGWLLGRESLFGDQDDAVSIAPGGLIMNQCGFAAFGGCGTPFIGTDLPANPGAPFETVVDFGAGEDRLANDGDIFVGTYSVQNDAFSPTARQAVKGIMRLEQLESFDNSGAIVLGGLLGNLQIDDEILRIDAWHDDILSAPGATFTGSGDSRILFDVNFNGSGQNACDPSLRDAEGNMPAADCVDLRGGATAGSTQIVIATDILPGDFGAYDPEGIVLVDVGGGESAPEHFTLSPESVSYDAELGVIDKGAFLYALGYDEETQQHKLYGAPGQDLHQMPLLAHAAQDLWRDTATSWFDRQADVRSALRGGAELDAGAWARAVADNAERTVNQQVTGGTTTVFFDNSYQQESRAVNLGVDFVVGQYGDSAWSVGAMLGYGTADLAFDDSLNRANFEGPSAGAYASFVSGGFFVDAAATGNWMTLDIDVPAFDLFPASAIVVTDVETIGIQAEAGWRWDAGVIGLEPLAGLSYARARFQDMDIPADDPASAGGAIVSYDDPVSMRGSLGLRATAENFVSILPTVRFSVTARQVEEFEGESIVAIANAGPVDAPLAQTFDGSFSEVSGAFTIGDATETVAAYLRVGGRFGEDYESTSVSTGFRYQW